MAEITKYGVTGKSLQEYKDEISGKYLEIDPDWNISAETPDGLQIAAWSELMASLDEEVVNAYHSVDPDAAMGQGLGRIALFAGLTRQAASCSTVTVEFSGDPLTTISSGTLVRHRVTGTLWATDSDVTTDDSGCASVGVTCTTTGANTADVGTLTIIAMPVSGISSVTNTTVASQGRDEETDNAFRYRRNVSVAKPGNNQIDNIAANLKNISGVKQVRVYENPEHESDSNGLKAHSMAIFIDGGEHTDITEVIATHKNPGCGLNRTSNFPNKVSEDTVTPKGQPLNVTYFRPELVSVYVSIDIKTTSLTETDKEKIRQAVVDYSLAGFDDTTGFAKTGFRIGESVPAGRLYTPVNYFVADDEFVCDIRLGFSGNDVSSQLLELAFNQLAVFDADNIEVNYV